MKRSISNHGTRDEIESGYLKTRTENEKNSGNKSSIKLTHRHNKSMLMNGKQTGTPSKTPDVIIFDGQKSNLHTRRDLLDKEKEDSSPKIILRVSEIEEYSDPSLQIIDNNGLWIKRENQKHSFSSIIDGRKNKEQQKELFSQIKPNLSNLLHGKSSILFSLGSFKSGKSFSIQGTTEHPGLIPRIVEYLFNLKEK